MDVQERECPKVNNLTLPEDWQLKAMQEYANIQIELAVDKYKTEISYMSRDFNYALQDSGYLLAIEDAVNIAPKILNEIKDR